MNSLIFLPFLVGACKQAQLLAWFSVFSFEALLMTNLMTRIKFKQIKSVSESIKFVSTVDTGRVFEPRYKFYFSTFSLTQ